MWALRAFVLGTIAVGVVTYAVVAALAVMAQAGGHALEFTLGPLAVVAVTRGDGATVTTFGPGLAAVALAGGLANLALAWVLQHRSGPPGDPVD